MELPSASVPNRPASAVSKNLKKKSLKKIYFKKSNLFLFFIVIDLICSVLFRIFEKEKIAEMFYAKKEKKENLVFIIKIVLFGYF